MSSSQVEYDLEKSSKDDLVLLSVNRVEQSAIPMAMTWYPPLTKESFIILANSQVIIIFCSLLKCVTHANAF